MRMDITIIGLVAMGYEGDVTGTTATISFCLMKLPVAMGPRREHVGDAASSMEIALLVGPLVTTCISVARSMGLGMRKVAMLGTDCIIPRLTLS